MSFWSERRHEAALAGLDQDKKDRLDRICEQAGFLLDADVTHLSIVLEEVQVYAGEFQLPEPLVELLGRPYRTPKLELTCSDLDYSMCKFVVQEGEPILVNDLGRSRFAQELLVRDHGLKAYLGVPVSAPDGVDIGALCALDPAEVRTWDADDVRTLQRFAVLANAVLHTSPTGS